MQQEIYAGLKKIPFLAMLCDETLLKLASTARSSVFPKHATIISEGDETDSLYLLISGKVRIFISDVDGKEVTLLFQESGSYFGELALLGNEPRSASVMTTEKTLCGIISKHDFKNWLLEHPDVALQLLAELSEKIRHLTDKVKRLALSNVYERTVKALLEIAVPEDDILVIHDRPTQQELANMVGSGREMINKVLKQLAVGGYLIHEDKCIKIVKQPFPNSW